MSSRPSSPSGRLSSSEDRHLERSSASVHQHSRKESTGRVRISTSKWEQMRPIVKDLYCDKGKTLSETRRILEEKYGFVPSAKTYKDKIKSWDLLKNNKRSGKYLQKHRRDSSERMRDTQEHAAPHIDLNTKSVIDKQDPQKTIVPEEDGNEHPTELSKTLPKALQLQWMGQDIASLNRTIEKGKAFEDEANYKEAERLFREAYDGYKYLIGPKESTLNIVRCISRVCNEQGKSVEAAELFEQFIQQMIERYGSSDRRTLGCLEEYAKLLLAQGRYQDSELILDRVLDAYGYDEPNGLPAKKHTEVWIRLVLLMADACLGYGNAKQAERLLTKLEDDLEALEIPQKEEMENKHVEIFLIHGASLHLSERAEKVLVDRLASIGDLNVELARKIFLYLSQHYLQSSDTEKLNSFPEKCHLLIAADALAWHHLSPTSLEFAECIALSWSLMTNNNEAEKWLLRIEKTFDSNGVDKRDLIRNSMRLGYSYWAQGKLAKAREKFEKSMNMDTDSTICTNEARASLEHIQASTPLLEHELYQQMIQWSS